MSNIKKEEDGLYLDEDMMTQAYGGDISREGMPDTGELTCEIIEILEFITTSEMLELKKSDYTQYGLKARKRFESFYLRYFGVFTLLLEGKVEIDQLLQIISVIDEVKQGKLDVDAAQSKVDESLSKKYIYPNLNKDQLNRVQQYKKNEKRNRKNNKKKNKKY